MLGPAGEETVQHPVKFRLVQQEGVVALVGLDFGKADVCRRRVQGVHDAAVLLRRV